MEEDLSNSYSFKVSVVIPTFNRYATIGRALDSVLAQTYKDFEVLVCDDASADETKDLVSTYSQKVPQIRLLSLPYNQGAGAARNIGMLAARGEYIAFLDSDDEWRPEKLALQVQRMDKEPLTVGICFCGATIVKDGNISDPKKYIPDLKWETDTFRKFVFDNISFLTPTIMIRKNCLSISGMMLPEMRRNQDGEFLLRLFNNFRLVIIPDDLVIVHLETQMERKIHHYDEVKNAFPFWEQHVGLIRQKSGLAASIKYISTRRTNLVTSAIREKLWNDAWRDFLKRLSITPWLWPTEIMRIIRALYRVLVIRS